MEAATLGIRESAAARAGRARPSRWIRARLGRAPWEQPWTGRRGNWELGVGPGCAQGGAERARHGEEQQRETLGAMGASRLGKGATTKEQDATADPSVRSTEPEDDGAMDGTEREQGEGGEAAWLRRASRDIRAVLNAGRGRGQAGRPPCGSRRRAHIKEQGAVA
jgi:hypothetical protein